MIHATPAPRPATTPLFGIPQRIPALQVRGGSVVEPDSLEDVEAILLKAGAESKLVVIDFTATWCGPCKMISPVFHELSESFDDVVFLKVDVDENPDTAAKYNVSAMPTFLFIKGGEIVDRMMGANPSKLQELIAEHK
ncbi:thioredoxin 1 [Fistulifera solaris]|uniref:Thioredoxin 1 n=1 Tax=Fistulifera solaris TaxID=1519565 RepID=A0A1Z5J715_FISSO|nr:thioredoxin 1 [Fistulifera solaris]|eukprot:GAX09726.1 thioredoxin 1 [Fistulifera solaris]